MSSRAPTPTPSEIDKWLETTERELNEITLRNKQTKDKKLNFSYQQEEDIASWIENTILEETEEIFNFLTEEKEKFLKEQNSTQNYAITNPYHNSTHFNTENNPRSETPDSTQPPQSIATTDNLDQSESHDQEALSEALSEKDVLLVRRSYNSTSRIIIATHNIREITRVTDQELMLEEIFQRNIGILGLSETKLTESNQNFAFKNSEHYHSFSSAGQERPFGSGVLLLIRKDIGKYIESVEKIPGVMIAINLLSRRRKIFICQVYLPCQKK